MSEVLNSPAAAQNAIKPNVRLARIVDSGFHLTRKLGLQSGPEKEFGLLHLQLRLLRHQKSHVVSYINDPVHYARNPDFAYSDIAHRKVARREQLTDRIEVIEKEIGKRTQALDSKSSRRYTTIERAINMITSEGNGSNDTGFLTRSIGINVIRTGRHVRSWRTQWQPELVE